MDEKDKTVDEVIELCKAARFTGVLRIHAAQGEGDVWFVSGIVDGTRFGVSEGDEAVARLSGVSRPKLELVARLPSPTGGGKKKGLPTDGALGPMRVVDLLRYCESNAITCTLELRSDRGAGRATYEIGDLQSIEVDDGDEAAVAEMLEWAEGRYRFMLPKVQLPSSVEIWEPKPLSLIPEAIEPEAQPALSEEARAKAKEHEDRIRRKAGQIAVKKSSAKQKAAADKQAEPVKTEPVKTEPVKAEPAKAEPVKAEPVKAKAVEVKVSEPPKAVEKAPEPKPESKSLPPRPVQKKVEPAVVVSKILDPVDEPIVPQRVKSIEPPEPEAADEEADDKAPEEPEEAPAPPKRKKKKKRALAKKSAPAAPVKYRDRRPDIALIVLAVAAAVAVYLVFFRR